MFLALPITLLTLLLLLCSLQQPSLASTTSLYASLWFRGSDAQEASAEYTDDDVFQQAVLNVTNTYRKQHNATSLAWNESLAEYAKEWSERCEFEHSVSVIFLSIARSR